MYLDLIFPIKVGCDGYFLTFLQLVFVTTCRETGGSVVSILDSRWRKVWVRDLAGALCCVLE